MKPFFAFSLVFLAAASQAASLYEFTGKYKLAGAGSESVCAADLAVAYKDDGDPTYCFTKRTGPRLETTQEKFSRAGRCIGQGKHGVTNGNNFTSTFVEQSKPSVKGDVVTVTYKYGVNTLWLVTTWSYQFVAELDTKTGRLTLTEKAAKTPAQVCVYNKL